MKKYLTKQDLASYLKKIDEATINNIIDSTYEPLGDGSGSFDSIPKKLRKPTKDIEEKTKKFIDYSLTKAISITKTYRGITLPKDLYDNYNKNINNAKEKLIAFVEKNGKNPEIKIEMEEDFTND